MDEQVTHWFCCMMPDHLMCAGTLVGWEQVDLKEILRGSPCVPSPPTATGRVPATSTPTQHNGLDLVGHARGSTPPSPLSELAAATKDDIPVCETQGLGGSGPVSRPFKCNPILHVQAACGKWTCFLAACVPRRLSLLPASSLPDMCTCIAYLFSSVAGSHFCFVECVPSLHVFILCWFPGALLNTRMQSSFDCRPPWHVVTVL
jgi:hypothetical protein